MDRDKLFLLRADFSDPTYPGRRFYCWHCALIEGLLASLPDWPADWMWSGWHGRAQDNN